MTRSHDEVAIPAPGWRAYLPGLALVTSYRRAWLPKDIVAGLVLSALLVPQGMAYAELAGLPPVTGLYTSILCLLGYAVFGPSRILVLGPDSSLGPMIAATIAPAAARRRRPGAGRRARVAARRARRRRHGRRRAGQVRLRRRPAVEADPDRLHERAGADHHRRPAAQAVRVLRRRRRADRRGARAFVSGLAHGEAQHARPPSSASRRWSASCCCNGCCPRSRACWSSSCSPPLAVNAVRPRGRTAWTRSACCRRASRRSRSRRSAWGDLPPLFVGALAIAVVALADTMSTASSFAARRGEQVRGNQEMIGIGAANIAAGLFQGFPVSTSGSRTAVAEQAGLAVPGHRGRRRGRDHLRPGLRHRADAVRAAADAGRHRHRGGALAGRHRRHASAVAAAADGVRPLDRRAPRRRPARRAARHPGRRRPVDPQRLPPGVVAAPGRARPGRRASRACTTPRRIPHAELLPGLVVYRFDAPLIFANARMFGEAVRAMAEERAGPALGRRRRRADHRRRHHRRRHAAGAGRLAQRARCLAGLRRDEGPGAREDRALRARPHDRPGALLPHARRGRRRLHAADRRDLAESPGEAP